jgi:PAS domain S-box-containing protein
MEAPAEGIALAAARTAYEQLQQQAAAPGLSPADLRSLLAESLTQQQAVLRYTEHIMPRKQAEQGDDTATELLQATIDSSLDMIQVFEAVRDDTGDIVDFRWILLNPVARQVYGEVVGQRLLVLNPGVVKAGIFDTFKQVVETGQPDQQERHYTAEQFDGWFTQSVVKLRDGVATTTADITARKQAEQQVLRLQAEAAWRVKDRYRALFNSLDEGVCLLELLYDERGAAVDYQFLEVNPVFERQTGLANASGKLGSEIAASTAGYWLATYAQVVKTGNPVRFETHHQGTGRWYEAYASRVGRKGSRQVCTVFNDITERKHVAERQQFLLQLSDIVRPLADPLAIQQAALHFVAEQLNLDRLLYNEINPDVTTYTVRAIYVREGFLAYGGVQPMEAFTDSVRDLQQGVTKVVYDVETDESFSLEERAVCAGIQVRAFVVVPLVKNERWVLNLVAHSSQPRQWTPLELGLLEETAERTWAAVTRAQAEAALGESEVRLRGLLDNLPGGAAFIVGPDLRYQLAAGEALTLTGTRPADFVGRPLAEALTPDELAAYLPRFHQALAGQPFVHEHVTRGRAFVSRGIPLRSPTGDITAALVVSYDITDRRRAEEAQRLSEQRLRIAVEAAQQGTWDWDLVTNKVRWNARHFELFGLEPHPDQLVTPADFERHVHPADRADVLQRLQTAIAEHVLFEAEFRAVTAQGEERWMSGYGQPTEWDADGRTRRMSGVMFDITARKQVELQLQELTASLERKVARRTQALQQSRDLLQSVYDTTLVGMAVLKTVRDEQGAIVDFVFVSVNRKWQAETNRTDLVGKRYTQEFPGIEPTGLLALMRQAVETGQPQQTEYYYPYEGVEQWYSSMYVRLDVDGLVVTTLNITARQQAEQEQQRTLTLLQQAEAIAGLGSWSYELATGQLLLSDGMYQLLGLPKDSVVAPDIYLELVVEEDRDQAQQFVQQLTVGTADYEGTVRLRVGEQVKTVRLQTLVLRNAAAAPVQVLGVDLDISQVRRLEADNLRLRLAQQQALFEAVLEAQETERKRIAEGLHNGLGQTLYATKLQLNQLLAGPSAPALVRADQLLTEAIRQTRTLSHELVPTALTDFGLGPALHDICRSLSSSQLRVQCTVELEQALPLPLQVALYRIAQELLQNVVKHARATHASLGLETVPDFVLLRVEDDGVGFAKESAAPTGLGLRTIRSRVALLNGTLDLGSSPTYGTYVRLRIPFPPLATPPAA